MCWYVFLPSSGCRCWAWPSQWSSCIILFLVGSWIIFRLLWQFWEKESHEWKDSFRYCWLMLKWFVVLAPLSNPPIYVLAFHVRNLICLASSCPFVWWSRLDVSSSSFRWSHAMKWKGFLASKSYFTFFCNQMIRLLSFLCTKKGDQASLTDLSWFRLHNAFEVGSLLTQGCIRRTGVRT